ncbi:MAG: hypothetical protein EAZ92_05710 [Candidatus Kapaibacterium sp.]|nr:MAG: hypothetical protein EAZ92_05710 [Candidatus Kapabacteria bacterium]
MRYSTIIARLLAFSLVALEFVEVPLVMAEAIACAPAAEYDRALPSALPICETALESPFPALSAPISASHVSAAVTLNAHLRISTALVRSYSRSRSRSRSKASSKASKSSSKSSSKKKQQKSSSSARKSGAKVSSRNSSKFSRASSGRGGRKRTSQNHSYTRYESRRSYSKGRYSKRYSRHSGKYSRGRHRYARQYRSSRSSSDTRYARVSDAVSSVRTGLAQNWHETLKDAELMQGVRYKHYLISTGNKHSVHVLEVDRTKPDIAIALFKGQNAMNGLERLSDMAARTDSTNGVLQGMINGSFWKSPGNMALGATIVNGEVLEMGQYKEWSACFFDRQNRMYIERFNMTGMIKLKSITLDIDKVNRRTNKGGVVLYNHFAGKNVPVQPPLQVEQMVEGGQQSTPDELSDTKSSKTELARMLQEQQRSVELERSLPKAVLLYSGQPAVNEEVQCRVIEVDTGAVNIPQNGVVLTFGDNIEAEDIPKPGDKIMVQFKTNLFSSVPFLHALSGTPRLVNRGIAKNEADFEGARGERFMSQKLPRTALGMDATGTMLYFVVVEGTSSENNTTGMTIQQLAEGMKQLGAYHAMSLDGGASSGMVVRGGTAEDIGSERRISLALGVVKQSATDRPAAAPRRKLISKPGATKPDNKLDTKDSNQATPSGMEAPVSPEKPTNGNSSGGGGASGTKVSDTDNSPSGKD